MTQWSWVLGRKQKGRKVKPRCGHLQGKKVHFYKFVLVNGMPY